jgi:hypothetical protein
MGIKETRDDLPCATCEIFLDMKKEGHFLKRSLKKQLISPIPLTVMRIIRRYIQKQSSLQ